MKNFFPNQKAMIESLSHTRNEIPHFQPQIITWDCKQIIFLNDIEKLRKFNNEILSATTLKVTLDFSNIFSASGFYKKLESLFYIQCRYTHSIIIIIKMGTIKKRFNTEAQ